MVSFTYILALFLTYLALGTVMFQFLYLIQDQILLVSKIISWFIIVMALFLFFFNFYDFLVSRKQEYGKIKNQLPKRIQKMNKKIIQYFTEKLTDIDGNPQSFIPLLGFTFLLGVIISLTEFMCTGQIYLPIVLALVQYSDSLNLEAILYLVIYNLMFVMPLIVIALVAIKSKSILSASNFIRENLPWIKLANALLFLGIAGYYILKVAQVWG
jgi:cytochrome c biogenesis protein CcdA